MDEETYEVAKDNDLDYSEAERLQEIVDEEGLDPDEAMEIMEEE